MSSALISPSEIIKCVQLLRKAVKATRNDKAGSAAKFEEAEQHLSRFEAVIAKYRSSHEAPPEVDAAIEACESAIKELDRKLNKYRGTFGDLETRRIRLKDFHVKVKFFNAVDGYLKEFDEAIARELRVFELWERVYEK
ncbi:hypothetical protein BJ508DRAFT_307155 [Ascobolus immersus RN42]|uniref:Uncharacterized protein n=1 Tax=Ascobolus immersus RN42 TaxID=1160509 RepID=A0A3N4I3M5_ASCIM|nr:hypothetical protein BJ508DRAFT_307155 [Ascobolus immersus RN42]